MDAQFSFKLLELTQEFIPDPEKAKTFVHQLQATVDHRMNQRLEPLATKADLQKEISGLRLEIRDQKVELMETIHAQKGELLTIIHNQKVDLVDLLQGQKTDLLKTIYIVGLVQFLGIVASVLAIMAFMG